MEAPLFIGPENTGLACSQPPPPPELPQAPSSCRPMESKGEGEVPRALSEEALGVSAAVSEEVLGLSPAVSEEGLVVSPAVSEEGLVVSPAVSEEVLRVSPAVSEEEQGVSPAVSKEALAVSPAVEAAVGLVTAFDGGVETTYRVLSLTKESTLPGYAKEGVTKIICEETGSTPRSSKTFRSSKPMDPLFAAKLYDDIVEIERRRPEVMCMKARAEEARARAVKRIMDIKESDPFAVLLRDVVNELVAGTESKKLQDAFTALAYELPVDFVHDHVAKLFPDDYGAPLCLMEFPDAPLFLKESWDPLSYTPYTNRFPRMYQGFDDFTCDVDAFKYSFADLSGLLGKYDDDDGELTWLHASYHRVARLIILLESLPSTPKNEEKFTALRNHIYQMLRGCFSVFCRPKCMPIPGAIKDWAITDIRRLGAKVDQMFEQNADGYEIGCVDDEIMDIRKLIYNTKNYFLS